MRIESPLITHTIEHLAFRFVSGLHLDVDLDYEGGDTIDWGEDTGQIDIVVVPKVALDGETKLAGRSYIVKPDQLAYVERSTRVVVDLTPEQQREQRVMIRNMAEVAGQGKAN